MAATATETISRNAGSMVEIAGNLVPSKFVFTTYHTKALSTAAILGEFEALSITDIVDTATTMYYASTDNTNDKAGGTGAFTMKTHGFGDDDAGVPVYKNETITLTGTTKITGSQTFDFIPFYHEVLTAGTGKNPAGDLKIGSSDHTAVYGVIKDGLNQSSILLIDLPSNVMGFYEMTFTFQNATTAYDGLYVTHFMDTHAAYEVAREVKKVHMRGIANLDKQNLTFSGVMKPGLRHRFYGEDIGTTAQTLDWSITWGFKFID